MNEVKVVGVVVVIAILGLVAFTFLPSWTAPNTPQTGNINVSKTGTTFTGNGYDMVVSGIILAPNDTDASISINIANKGPTDIHLINMSISGLFSNTFGNNNVVLTHGTWAWNNDTVPQYIFQTGLPYYLAISLTYGNQTPLVISILVKATG